jgi:hypothetical protein
MSDKKYFCQDCIFKGQGRAMGEAEWIQHLSANPTHMPALDENEEEERDLDVLVKD